MDKVVYVMYALNFKNRFVYFNSMRIIAFMYVHRMFARCWQRLEESVLSPRTGAADSCTKLAFSARATCTVSH